MGFDTKLDNAFLVAASSLTGAAPRATALEPVEIHPSKDLFDMTAPIFAQALANTDYHNEEIAALLTHFSFVCKAARPNQFTTQTLANCLIEFVVTGKERQANELLTTFPFLLNKKGSATDLDGRLYQDRYPIEAAFEVLDVQMMRMIDQVGQAELGEDYTPLSLSLMWIPIYHS